jgi:signal peptidase I
MDIDFPLVLVVLTLACAVIWLVDVLMFRAGRVAAAEAARDEVERTDLLKEHWLVDNARSFFPVLLIVLVLRSFVLEPFQIPSGSMLPTLEVGDFILVNKYDYGLRLPVLGTKIVSLGTPQRGDVMVFKYPKDGKTSYIKRVIGMPGDHIRYADKQLYLNGEKVEETFLAKLAPELMYQQKLGSAEFRIYENMMRALNNGAGEWTVPSGHYFVMGDNRDNSNDSRFWGFVPDELVVGRAFAIWMQWTTLGSIPTFDRVGFIR